MKILVFTTLFPNGRMPNHAVFVKERIANMAKLCDVRVVAPVPHFPKLNICKKWFAFSQVPSEEEIDGVRVYHPRYFVTPKLFRSLYGFFMFLDVLSFMKGLKREYDFDIIDAHFVYPDGLAAVLLGKALGKKVVVTARGTDIHWYPKFRIIRNLIRYCLRRADAVISVNDDLKDKMVKLGAAADKISVIHSGVDLQKFYPLDKSNAKAEIGINRDKKIILSAGRLIEAKGFQYLVTAMELIRCADADLYIIGDGEYRRSLEDLIAKCNVKSRIHICGEMPQEDLARWYRAADLFCFFSLNEGRPNVILESLASGTPVLTMNKWGLPELIKKDAGVMIDSYDPHIIARNIDKALDVRWDQKTIVDNVKDLSWDRTSKSLLELYDKILNKHDVLFFSSDDWNSGLKTSKYHLATRLARDNRVFFINSIGLRTPSASARDAKRIFAKLAGFFRGITEARDNLFVYTPIAIPFQGIGPARFVNNMIITFQIKMIMAKFGVRDPLVWTFLPNSLGVVRRLRRRALIYYCVDDMSAFKGVPSDIIGTLDEALTKEADIVFAVSKELFEKKKMLNKNTFYSPHGVDFELFNRAVTEKAVEKPSDVSDIPRPIIGFYGLISSDWIDYDLVRFISSARPDWSLVFVGKIDTLKDAPPEAKNIYYLPVKPYEELYRYSRFFDVAILPFNVNKLTIHSHPLKILEYLAAGKPVVSIDIPEIRKYQSVIEVARDKDGFLRNVEKCINNNNNALADERIKFAALNSWEKRFYEIQDTVHSHI